VVFKGVNVLIVDTELVRGSSIIFFEKFVFILGLFTFSHCIILVMIY
jgi:hypothetical protein